MKEKKGIIWSYTKGEFVVFDHYYFSILYDYLKNNYTLEIPTSFSTLLKLAKKNSLVDFNTIIFNYPEKRFTKRQIDNIIELFNMGKRIVFLTYYKNEDNSSYIANSILQKVGLYINNDEIIQNESIHNNDKYLIITDKINEKLKDNVEKIIIPCSSSISFKAKDNYSYSPLVKTYSGDKIIAMEVTNNKNGKIIAFGSCVFWDNFSIVLYNNFQFVKNLINYLLEG